MSDTPTPEVDAIMRDIPSPPKTLHIERLARRARRLERERDEARGELAKSKEKDMGAVVIMSADHRDHLESIESERDQLRAINAELLEKMPKTRDGHPIFLGDTVYMPDADNSDWPEVQQVVAAISVGTTFPEYEGDFTILGDNIECGNLECSKAKEAQS